MKKALIAIFILLFLCVICGVVLFFAARALPALMNALPQQVQDIVQTGMEEDGTINDAGDDTEVDQGTYKYNDGETSWEINTGETTWPEDMPSSVPQFEYGTIESVNRISSSEGTTWSVIYNSVSDGAYNGYKSDVTNAGFVDLFTFETEDGWSVGGNKDDVTLFSVFDNTEGKMSLVVTQLVEEK